METFSLYRKYRPHNFDNLVGQDHIKSILINALKSGRVSHAYLFAGPRGTGKTSAARLMAKALTCTSLQEGFDPCNECDFCNDINSGHFIDLIEVDAASNRGIDEVRDLREKIRFAPTRAKAKIYIIDEVHMMTKEAFNALLKTLEEPPDHAYFILATTEVHKLPDTIVSRCQRFNFTRISNKALMTRLSYIAQKEGIEAEDSALEAISKYVDGGLRDAIGLVQQLTTDKKLKFNHVRDILGVSDFSLLENLYKNLLEKDVAESLEIVHELHSQGSDLRQFIHEFVDLLRQNMLQSVASEDRELTGQLLNMIETFQSASHRLDNGIPQLALEMTVVEICGAFEKKLSADTEPDESVAVSKEKPPADFSTETTREHKSLEEKIDLTPESLKEKWPRIVERIKTPALKMSLKNGIPLNVENQQVYLAFDTNFHSEKVMESSHRIELESVMKDFFGVGVKIVAKVKDLDLKPVVEEKKKNEKGNVDKALNIFGGELV